MDYQATSNPTPPLKVPVYFIGVNYPPEVVNLMYLVRGSVYKVPTSGGVTEVGGVIMVNQNDVKELINKARYFDGKKLVEVLTTDATIAAAVKKAYDSGRSVPLEARLPRNDNSVIIAPSKDEIIATMSAEELRELAEIKEKEAVVDQEAVAAAKAKKDKIAAAKKAKTAEKAAKLVQQNF